MTIDLAALPDIDFVEQFTAEQLFEKYMAELAVYDAELAENLKIGDPVYSTFLALAARERLRLFADNEAVKSILLAYANDGALDHIGTTFHRVERLADESNEAYRARIAQGPDGSSVAGPVGAYLFHARSASGRVADVSFLSPEPLDVVLTVLSHDNNGIADQDLIDTVLNAVNPDDIRPEGDVVTVQAAQILDYVIDAVLYIYNGPDSALVVAAAEAEVAKYCAEEYRLKGYVAVSGVESRLHQTGVQRVDLQGFVDVAATAVQAPRCTAINLAVVEVPL